MASEQSSGRCGRDACATWVRARFEETTHCKECGQLVQLFDSYCENCGQSDPARVKLSATSLITSAAVIAALAISGLTVL